MAVSNVGVDYRATPLSEMLMPELSYAQSVKTSTLIKDRINNIIYPRTGQQNYSITSSNQPVIEFQLSNTAFTDHTTPCLLMDVQLTFNNVFTSQQIDGITQNTRVLATESLCPWFYQVQEMVNSSLIETTTDVDLANMFRAMWQQPFEAYRAKSTYACPSYRFQEGGVYPVSDDSVAAGPNYVISTQGGLVGGAFQAGVAPDQVETEQWLGVIQSGLLPASGLYSGPVVQVIVPLSWMAIFSGSSYLPPYATSNVLLKLYTNQIQRIFSVANTFGTTTATINGVAAQTVNYSVGPGIASVNLNNVRLSYDAVVVSPAVEDAMSAMLNAGGKIFYPVVHHRVQNDVGNLEGPQGGPKQFLLNCATSNLISLFQFFLKDTQLTSLNDPLSYMPNVGFGSLSQSASNRYYVQIGSKTFPSVSQVVGAGSMWLELLKALGDGPILADRDAYFPIGDLDPATAQSNSPVIAGIPAFNRSGCFALGINFERIIGAVSQSANAGVSTRGVSGIIQSYLAPASATSTNVSGVDYSSLRSAFRLISVMLYLEYLIIERGGVLSTNV